MTLRYQVSKCKVARRAHGPSRSSRRFIYLRPTSKRHESIAVSVGRRRMSTGSFADTTRSTSWCPYQTCFSERQDPGGDPRSVRSTKMLPLKKLIKG
ncbi:hypothetical protein PAXRUDRAFT_832003 [Paxillus rubicundulus Ve08.2h10]|uniref:Uncharacterized protein n=1 Tax=Paxillus rubicundulus Ve08.2h10 TaxID=930991 RepID=A0A0D0D762_9AGAM|nr:hypothetical protein PAXRUDRAFT_832003 [Paxillus rubicundulus Ve08.2h10]